MAYPQFVNGYSMLFCYYYKTESLATQLKVVITCGKCVNVFYHLESGDALFALKVVKER